SGLGAAINAAVGTGHYPDYETAVGRMTSVGDVFMPNPANQELYDRIFKDVYSKLYGRLKPLYRSLRDITGYPP
ncbi:MAG: hypothetical protein JHC87_05895, partial [Thermoleophilaceae bacterium]|nr:hypothetical protein [Thermoleophilaceae bacterium]